MNGANKIDEADSRPLNLCPICLKKFGAYTNITSLQKWTKSLLNSFIKSENECFSKEISQL